MVSVGTGGHESDSPATSCHRLMTGDVGVRAVDRQQHQPLRWPALPLRKRGGTADELALVEGDVAIKARHRGRIGLRIFQRPDAKTLLEPQAVLGAHADRLHTEVGTRREQRIPQSRLLRCAHVDFVAQLASQ